MQMTGQAVGSILAIVAHPDDAELWMGGTLALHAASATVTVLVATEDDVRKREALQGAEILGVRVEVVDQHSPEKCGEAIRRLRPDIVITHRLDECHGDHRAVADLTLKVIPRVFIDTGRPLRLYSCDSYESVTLTGLVEGRVIVDVTQTYEKKKRALAAHESQPLEHFQAMADRLAASWGGRVGVRWAESFDAIPILGRLPARDYL